MGQLASLAGITLVLVATLSLALPRLVERSRARRGAVAADSTTAARQPAVIPQASADDLATVYAKLRKIETDVNAIERDRADFEEMVKRWMGRTNKQEARDRAAVAPAGTDTDQLQLLPDAPRPPTPGRLSTFNGGRPALRARTR